MAWNSNKKRESNFRGLPMVKAVIIWHLGHDLALFVPRFNSRVIYHCRLTGGVMYALSPAPYLLLLSRIICGLGASCTPLLFAWTARALNGVDEMTRAQLRLNTVRCQGVGRTGVAGSLLWTDMV